MNIQESVSVTSVRILPPGSTDAELQTAIDEASFGDIIQISGDMPFSSPVTIRSGLEITIQSTEGNNWSMYQFNPSTRHFIINGSLILENITLDGREIGGGIQLNVGALATEDGAVIQNCHGVLGGGVYVVAGVFSIYGGEIKNNVASESGGGVYITAGYFNMTAFTGIISGNKAVNGGGVYVNGGTYDYTGGKVSENEANNGGGLYINSGALNMERGHFNNNTATSHGGGIYSLTSATLTISGTSENTIFIEGNKALSGDGGGIYTEDSTYGNVSTGNTVIFRCNISSDSYAPPESAGTLYPNIQFAETTIVDHPLNNHDINCKLGDSVESTFCITYNCNGGSGSYVGPNIGPCETDTVLTTQDTGIAYADHAFVSWNTMPDGSGDTFMPGDDVDLDAHMILYAQWKPDKKQDCEDFCEKFLEDFCDEFSKRFCKVYNYRCKKTRCRSGCSTAFNDFNSSCRRDYRCSPYCECLERCRELCRNICSDICQDICDISCDED